MAAEDSEVAVPSLSLRDFILVVRRRKFIALITFLLVVGVVGVSTLLTKPQYRSVASLLLEEQKNNANTSEISEIFAPQAGMAVDSQVQLLNSPLIINKVYEESKVAPGSIDLTVSRSGNTSKIDIVGVSNSREDVRNFVAMVPNVYQDNRRAESAREVTAELNFAEKDLAQENQKLDKTEAAIAAFKTKYDLIDPGAEASQSLTNAANAKTNLAASRAEISSLRAQISALRSDLSALPARVNTPVTVTNPKIRELEDEKAGLQSERARQLFYYKENDDVIRQLDRRINNLTARIANTPRTITNNSSTTNPAVAELRTRINTARADLSAKEAAVGVLSTQSAALDSALGRYTDIQRQQSQLDRDLAASQIAVKDGKEKVRQLSARARALEEASASVTILQPGTSGKKIAPNPSRNMILGVFVGLLLACAAALLQDSLDDRVRDEQEARQILGAPVLGYFPLLPVSDERQILDMTNPDRLLLESFRALRSNVQFALVNSTGKKLQVTSTVPNEGKSYIASNLAITMALDGRQVILVDADLHRPTMHERFGAKRQPGLTNVLVGEATLEAALQDAGFPGLRLLSAGALPPNPAELLNSPTMSHVMEELEGMADLIIFDTPPLLATSDSQLMSAKMDGVIFVMQMGSVARSGTLRAFELLRQAQANLIGIVFNKVDRGKNSMDYEQYSSYYDLEADVPTSEILTTTLKTLPARSSASNGASSENGAHKSNGSKSNDSANRAIDGAMSNGSHGQPTVFDEAIQSDENSV